MRTESIAKAVRLDGGLFSDLNYLNWRPGDETATLDGSFTAQELRDIADHMEAIKEL